MAQTSFDAQDAEDLLKELEQFHEAIRDEWSRVLNQWNNLKSVWRDQQFDRFEPIFEKFISTYMEAEKESDQYIRFVREQIEINENKKQKLAGRLADL